MEGYCSTRQSPQRAVVQIEEEEEEEEEEVLAQVLLYQMAVLFLYSFILIFLHLFSLSTKYQNLKAVC
jgi:hypothetical protein